MQQPTPDPEHYDDCPISTDDSPAWAPNKCRCEAINAEDEAYYAEPPNMFAMEWGNY